MTRLILAGDILLGNVNTSPKSKDVENTNDTDCNIGMGQESCAMDVNSRGMNLIKLVQNNPPEFVPSGETEFRKASFFSILI